MPGLRKRLRAVREGCCLPRATPKAVDAGAGVPTRFLPRGVWRAGVPTRFLPREIWLCRAFVVFMVPPFDPLGGSCYGALTLCRLRYLRAGARALTAAFLVGVAPLLLTGCGPIQYLNQVNDRAAVAVLAAKNARAAEYAPYEYTAATEYLNKAREEGDHAEYQIAIEYGRRAEALATRALAIAEKSTAAAAARGPAPIQPSSEPPRPAKDSP